MVAMTGELARERTDSHINELLLYRRVAWRSAVVPGIGDLGVAAGD